MVTASWPFNEALREEGWPQAESLNGSISRDVCIVGGGYTGLWTAILLKQVRPELQIALIEQELCGYGASGCNGGCVLTLATKFLSLDKFFGTSEAIRLVKASEQAVNEIDSFCKKYRVDCELQLDGAYYIATNRAQVGVMNPVLDQLDRQQINSWCELEIEQAKQRAGTKSIEQAHHSDHAGSVHPAKLVRGLRRVALALGVEIYEKTPLMHLKEAEIPVVHTPEGSILAKKVVLATNAWMASLFRQFTRSIAVVSSDVCVTEPCRQLLDMIGLNHGATICDSRIFVHYFHATGDGRLLFGKGGNTFAYRSRMIRSFFEPSGYRQQLRSAIDLFLPELKDVKIDACWNGGSDRSVTGFPFFGKLNNNPNILYGFGYSGNGVTQALLGGKILRSLVLEIDDDWSRCGFVGGPRGYFPPEPIRYIGAHMVRNAIRRKEKAEDAERQPNKFDSYLARFAKAAGKADK
jgi:putative aminophosphonate oxidoreductase